MAEDPFRRWGAADQKVSGPGNEYFQGATYREKEVGHSPKRMGLALIVLVRPGMNRLRQDG